MSLPYGPNGVPACFVVGIVLWRFDFVFCDTLTAMKHAIGMPWSYALELHGWWHVLTAVGAYVFMVMVDDLTTNGGDTPMEKRD